MVMQQPCVFLPLALEAKGKQIIVKGWNKKAYFMPLARSLVLGQRAHLINISSPPDYTKQATSSKNSGCQNSIMDANELHVHHENSLAMCFWNSVIVLAMKHLQSPFPVCCLKHKKEKYFKGSHAAKFYSSPYCEVILLTTMGPGSYR